MNRGDTLNHWSKWLLVPVVFSLCVAAGSPTFQNTASAASSSAKKSYEAVAINALPGLQCKLYPAGGASSAGIAVFTDDDGYARFYAVRAVAGDAVQRLSLDCTDSAGTSSSYAVDLTSADTFAPRRIDLASERGIDRPALKGNPLSYT